MEKLMDKTAVETPANFVAQAVQCGTPQQIVLTPEQTEEFCVLKAVSSPPTLSLIRAAARPRRFPFVAR